MAAVNYYIGALRGSDLRPSALTVGTSSAGTAVDVELRMQLNNGTNVTGLTKEDVLLIIDAIENWVVSGGDGQNFSGGDLPPI